MRIDPSWGTMPAMTRSIVIVGVPTSLGGHLAGMERTPAGLRELGLLAALDARPLLDGAEVRDAGDLAIEPGFVADRDPRAKNRARICEFLPRERDLIATVLGGTAGGVAGGGEGGSGAGSDVPRQFILGGDCTAHAGAMAG